MVGFHVAHSSFSLTECPIVILCILTLPTLLSKFWVKAVWWHI